MPLAQRLMQRFDPRSHGRLLILAPLVGVVAGLGACVFQLGLDGIQDVLLNGLAGLDPLRPSLETGASGEMPHFAWILLLPALGGLASGWLVFRFAPEAEGHGTDAVVRSFHRDKGAIRRRVPVVKTISSMLTIGSGGSAGREGPIAQIGAGFGSWLATAFHLTVRERRILMMAGAAGGIGAIFHAPLGGALFAAEVLYREPEFESDVIIPSIASSIVAYSVFVLLLGKHLVFHIPETGDFSLGSPVELPLYALLGLVCGLAGILYVEVFYGVRNRCFQRLSVPPWIKPGLGGLLVGALACYLPQVLGGGYGWMQEALAGNMTLGLLLLLAGGKVVATSLTVGSGGSGGVFAPSLFIGAMLGGGFGILAGNLSPTLAESTGTFALVGMGAFFSGVANVPITSLVMVCEMSGSYGLLVPLMLSCTVSYVCCRRHSIYREQVRARVDSPAHLGDFVLDVLEEIRVREVLNPNRETAAVHEGMTLRQIATFVLQHESEYYPVVDAGGEMVGIFSLNDIRGALQDDAASDLINARDICRFDVITVYPDDDLHTALRRFTMKNIDEIPVVDPENPRRILGMLGRKELIAAYDRKVEDLRREAREQMEAPAEGAGEKI